MQREQMELVREVRRGAAAAPIGEAELSGILTRLFKIIAEVSDESAGGLDRKILDLFFVRKMAFPELALEIGITESAAKRSWYRLLDRIDDGVTERLRSDENLASVLSWRLENPDALRLVIPTLLPIRQAEPHAGHAELAMLKRAKKTFGTSGEAVRWLLDDCPALNARPIDLAANSRGAREVENVLACIDHGMIY